MDYFKHRQSFWRKGLLIGLLFGISYVVIALTFSLGCAFIPIEDYDTSYDTLWCRNIVLYLTLALPIYFSTLLTCALTYLLFGLTSLSCGGVIHVGIVFLFFALIPPTIGVLGSWIYGKVRPGL